MKEIIVLAEILIASSISLDLSAQENPLLQKLPALNTSELTVIENNLSLEMKREAATRTAGQFNAIIFTGADNTGKQNTARYLAKKIDAVIYRIDLSKVVSNNIGETEKNLAGIFEAVKNKNCLLYFDEAPALFGRRTPVSNAHDRYDNEGTNYFFRAVEKYRTSIIISVTVSNNINPLIFEKFVRFSIN